MTYSINAHLVAISDIHLQSLHDLRGKRLLALIEAMIQGEVEALVLIGDIFEFLLGSNGFFQRKFAPLGEALSRLSEKGTKVVYLEGNHEFDINKLPWPGVQLIQDRDYSLEVAGKRFKFTHGDLIYSPLAYRRFRRLVKARWFLGICQRIPGPIMDWIALRSSEASRAQDQYRELDTRAIYNAMSNWLGEDGEYGLFGHFHVPFEDETPKGGQLWSMSSWDDPSVLIYKDNELRRHIFHGEDMEPSRCNKRQPICQNR